MQDTGFLFSPDNVLRDIRFFNALQKSCYLEVLAAQQQHRRFSPETLLTITGELTEAERAEFLEVFEHDNGGYFIGWADAAIEKRLAYRQSRRNNRKSKTKKQKHAVDVGARSGTGVAPAVAQQPISKTYVFDMENENKKENKYKNGNRNETEPKNEKTAPEKRKTDPGKATHTMPARAPGMF